MCVTHKPLMPISSNWVFTLSRWVGAVPFDGNGKPTTVQTAYHILTATWIFFSTIIIRVLYFIKYTALLRKNAPLGFKTVLGLLMNVSLLSTCLCHTLICVRKKEDFLFISKHLKLKSTSTNSKLTLSLGMLVHMGGIITAFSYYVSKEGIVFPFSHSALNLSLLHFYNFVITIQYWSLLEATSSQMNSITRLIPHKKVFLMRHQTLLKIAKMVNAIYEKDILITLAQIFGYASIYSYNLIHGDVTSTKTLSQCCPEIIAFSAHVVAFKFGQLFLLTAGPENVQREVSHLVHITLTAKIHSK